MEWVTLELKYCERCGALGLRRSQSSETYCGLCARLLTLQVRQLCRGPRRMLRRLQNQTSQPLAAPAVGVSAACGVKS